MTDGTRREYAMADIESSSPAAVNHDEDVQAPLLPLAVSSQENSDEQLYKEEPMYKDRCWAIAFKVNVLVTLFSAVWFGTMGIKALMNDSLSSAGRRRLHIGDSEDSNESEEPYGHPAWNIFLGMLAVLAIVCVVACGMLQTLYNCGRKLLFTSYIIFAGYWGIAGVYLLFTAPLMALFPILICAFIVIIMFRRKRRIIFGAANLKVATMALQSMPWTFRSALLMGVVQFMWCTVAAIAALGSFVALETVSAPNGDSYKAIECVSIDTDTKPSCMCNGEKISDAECEHSGLGLPLMVIWLLSMSWGCLVLKNVVACTVTGSVASWWFSPNEDTAPVKGAFHRATGSSFGSLCKAAAVQYVVAVIAAVVSRVLRFVPCASFILRWINRAVKYALAYTIAFIGIYGLDFASAGRRVSELFQQRGVTTLASDVTVEVGLRLLALSTAIVYAIASMMTVGVFLSLDKPLFESNHGMDTVEFWSICGPQVFGFFACFFVIGTVLELARSGYKAVFVCFVQDPAVLAQKHDPAVHEHLHAAWIDMQNERMPVEGAPVRAPTAVN